MVVAASGNDGWADAVADPACVPRVVRVGAVYDRAFQQFDTQVCRDFNVLPDQVTCFSNSAGFLSMLAPGAVIQFATLAFAGTSQAAPHVAGAIAALRTRGSRYRTDPSDCMVARLVKTGTGVSDPRNGLLFPRLDLDRATQTLPNSTGDCDGNGRVEVSEVETGVSIILGDLNLALCPRFDPTEDGTVTIDELVTSVNLRIHNCAVGASGVV